MVAMNGGRAEWIRPPGPIAPGLRIGLLGGSFNPAHAGHLHASEIALKRLGLDYVWWLVSPQNPLKPARGMAPLDARLAGARRLVQHSPRIRVTGIEGELGTRYTIDTIARLKGRFPQARFVWIMGSDNLATFHHWRRWPDIVRNLPIAVVRRPGSALAPLASIAAQRFRFRSAGNIADATPPAIVVFDARRRPESATAIRARGVGPTDCAVLQ
ncbi:MAG TPA: nicotinate-nucleotide adenylyltransferase [Rhizomicrobium sp.]|jgi:nicotinate-nucleotide adenylyltransferase